MGLVANRYLLSARNASVLAQNKHLATSDRDTVTRHRHDETCKLEAKPRQDIQVSRLSQDGEMKNHVSRQDTCLETASLQRGNYDGKIAVHCRVQGLSAMSCAKTAIKIQFRMLGEVGQLHGVHIGTAWRVQLNCPWCDHLWNYSDH